MWEKDISWLWLTLSHLILACQLSEAAGDFFNHSKKICLVCNNQHSFFVLLTASSLNATPLQLLYLTQNLHLPARKRYDVPWSCFKIFFCIVATWTETSLLLNLHTFPYFLLKSSDRVKNNFIDCIINIDGITIFCSFQHTTDDSQGESLCQLKI